MTFTLTNTTADTSAGSIALTYNRHGNADQQITQGVSMVYPTVGTSYRVVRATIPVGSKFQIGAHWHEEYDEYMRVLSGRGKIRLGDSWKVYSAADGDILIKRGVVHDIKRADVDEDDGDGEGEDFVWEEWTEPSDGSKELFFRHTFSSVGDAAVFGWKLPLQQLLVLMYCDTYISVVPGPAGWYVTHGLYAVLRPLAGLLGLKPFYDEYTPDRLVGIRREIEGGVKRKNT